MTAKETFMRSLAIAVALLMGVQDSGATPSSWKASCAAAGNVPGTSRPAWCEKMAGTGCVPCPRPVSGRSAS